MIGRSKYKANKRRRGAAIAEMALTLPFLVTFVLGSIELCSMVFLRQALVVTAYEGARTSIRDEATTDDARARAQQVLAARNVAGATIVFDPANIEGLDRGTVLSVTVSAPADQYSIVPILNIGGRTLTATTTMVKE
jgi:Flp pilus assembly protein TadG